MWNRFPVLTGRITFEDYHDTKAFDPTYRSPYVAGYEARRSRATWVPKKWLCTGRILTDADKSTLQTLEENAGYGADKFWFYHPRDKKTYFVCFGAGCLPLDFTPEPKDPTRWRTKFIFQQVNSSESESSSLSSSSSSSSSSSFSSSSSSSSSA